MFDKFDVVIMGHVHQFQILQKDPLIIHLGSMERTDFGESSHCKVFMIAEIENQKINSSFLPLPIRSLHDIVMDLTSIPTEVNIVDAIKDFLKTHNEKQLLENGIVRIEILVREDCIDDVDVIEVKRLLNKEFSVNNCVGVYVTSVAKRQMRDSTITEKINPFDAFEKYINNLEEDQETKQLMERYGRNIMGEK
jgi:DNA repair exonuclease SbcCD nuclease subunit